MRAVVQRVARAAVRVEDQVVGQIGAGHSIDDILADYPYLEREDIMQASLCCLS